MIKNEKRQVDILVISDLHLGTYGCHAKELLCYMKSIKPGIVVLNGDIIDIWQFSKRYWPKNHMKVVKQIFHWMGKGIKTYYVSGNHDEMIRKFVGLQIGSLEIVNKIVLDLPDGKKAWVFHGDVFDVTMQHSKWLTKLGAVGYDILILINRFVNFFSEKVFNKGKISLSKKIKDSVKSAVSFVNSFEQTSAEIGISNKFDYVVCGHIHKPAMRKVSNSEGSIMYLNSGDWVENLTALEYVDGSWSIYKFDEADYYKDEEDADLNVEELFENMLAEFNAMKK
ncbi:MAG: UDP-2,3-diacylglucosamine diphosphatase [Sphingobacteriales bacterium]|nr:MAG: UDP-2,3-diacylglucosamine diphosphatase [Sphingobacteriales bacterium]